MASPNYDLLSVRLSLMAKDPVASATSNGQVYASTRRDRALNGAIRQWLKLSSFAKRWGALRSYVRTASGTLSSGKVLSVSSFSPTVFVIKSVFNTTQSKIVDKLPSNINRQEITNPPVTGLFSGLYWEWENGDLFIVNGATSDSVKVEYVKSHTDLSANGSNDTDVPITYWDEILDLALKILLQENPTAENLAIAAVKNQEARDVILNTGQDA